MLPSTVCDGEGGAGVVGEVVGAEVVGEVVGLWVGAGEVGAEVVGEVVGAEVAGEVVGLGVGEAVRKFVPAFGVSGGTGRGTGTGVWCFGFKPLSAVWGGGAKVAVMMPGGACGDSRLGWALVGASFPQKGPLWSSTGCR